MRQICVLSRILELQRKSRLMPERLKLKGAGKGVKTNAREFIEKIRRGPQMKGAAEQACTDWHKNLRHCSAQNGNESFI